MTQQHLNCYEYLPVYDRNEQVGFYLTGLGRARIPAATAYPPPGHPEGYDFSWGHGRILKDYQMVLITEGQGTFECTRYGQVKLEAGSFIYLYPGVWHRYQPDPRTGWTEYWVSMSGANLNRMRDNGLLQLDYPVQIPELINDFTHLHQQLWTTVQKHLGQNTLRMSGLTAMMMAVVYESLETHLASVDTTQRPQQSAENVLVHKALQLIYNNIGDVNTVTQVAKKFSVTRRTIERHFKKVLGHTIQEEINRNRLERAKEQLRKTTLSIDTIARTLGFKNPNGLRNLFSQYEQCTPLQYRKLHRPAKKHRQKS